MAKDLIFKNFQSWANQCGLKASTIEKLVLEDLDSMETLLCLDETTIDNMTEITLGQRLLLKKAIEKLKCGIDEEVGASELTDHEPITEESQPSTSTGQLTLQIDERFKLQLGPELKVDAAAPKNQPENTEVELEKQSQIYSLKEGDRLYNYHKAINDAAKELCLTNPLLLVDRKKLTDLARSVVHEKGYLYKKGASRSKKFGNSENSGQGEKKRMSEEMRDRKINDLKEDLMEVDMAISLSVQQREKYKNVNDLSKAINLTEQMSDLRQKKRNLQSELSMLEQKATVSKKAKASKLKKEQCATIVNEKKTSVTTITIDKFFTSRTQTSDNQLSAMDITQSDTTLLEEKESPVNQVLTSGLTVASVEVTSVQEQEAKVSQMGDAEASAGTVTTFSEETTTAPKDQDF